MNNPLVSVVIPVYNGSNYLAEAIDSALAQTYSNIEVIVVNDGSNDNGATEKVALSYGDKIRYFKKENGGISSALNTGIQEMKGEYFSWLSHDDIYTTTKIEKQVSLLQNPEDIVLCSGKLMDADKKPIPYNPKTIEGRLNGLELFDAFLHEYTLNGLGFLVPKTVFEKVGLFDETMQYLQDLDLWLRIMMQDFTFVCHKDLLVVSRVHKNQTTNLKSDLFDVDREKLIKKHIDLLKTVAKQKEVPYLERYYYLVVKGNNKAGVIAVNQRLKELNIDKTKLVLRSLPYHIISKAKQMKRTVYNGILKIKGERS